jgi:predicted transposase YbfD/YdcC
LENANLVGEQLRYVITYQGQWVALVGWSAAAFHLKDREQWLRWSHLQRRGRLHLVAQNSRFVVLVDRTAWPNLATRALALVTPRLSQDWQQAYGHPIAAVESFVDSQLFRGTAYKASNWKLLGKTDGFQRVAEDFYTRHDRPKQLWVKSLVADAPALLSAERLPEPWCAFEKPPPVACGISCAHLPSLFERFRGLTDSRKGQGKRHRLATIYAIIACAKLSGRPGGYRAIYLYARNLTKPQRRALHCWINPRTGEYEVPSETSFFRALRLVTVEQVQAIIDPWLNEKLGPASPQGQVAIDGKTLNHSGVHLVSAMLVPSQRCLGVQAVADKTNEITAVRQLLQRTDVEGRLVEMDALNTQDETVQKILYEKGADYIVSIKDNQPTLATTAHTLLPPDVPPQVVTREDNRSRQERRAIATRTVTPEQLGLAGAHQLALVQRTRFCPGAAFVAEHLNHPAALAAELAAPTDELAKSLRAALPAKVRPHLSPPNGAALDKEVPAALVRALNKVAQGPGLYNSVRFPDSILSDPTKEFRAQNPSPKGGKLARFNRLLLRDAYPQAIDTEPKPEFDWLATSRELGHMGAEAFLGNNRQYWGIENGTHQRLDCSALEDRLRIHDPNAVEILGFLHRVSLSLFVAWADQQPNVRDRTYPTWQADHQAKRWIMIRQVTQAPT